MARAVVRHRGGPYFLLGVTPLPGRDVTVRLGEIRLTITVCTGAVHMIESLTT